MEKNYQAFIFDMDGVLRCGNEKVSGADKIVNLIGEKNIPTLILTNECRYTKDQIIKDFQNMKIDIPKHWNIYTSACCMRDFLIKLIKNDQTTYIYILGEEGLKSTIAENVELRDKIKYSLPLIKLSCNTELFVIIGALNKIKDEEMEEAIKWIRCGAKIITTCPDVADPGSKGENPIIMPNHILHIIKKIVPCASYCIGKPNPIIVRQAISIFQKNFNLKLDETLLIGDSLDTDIKMAFELGIDSALVLTGNTRMYMIKNNIIQPNYIFHSVKELCDMINDR